MRRIMLWRVAMSVDRLSFVRLSKVLALTDSSHEGEAMAALRLARHMMARNGLSFADLVAAGETNKGSLAGDKITALQAEIARLHRAQQEKDAELVLARQTIAHLRKVLARIQKDGERWQKLAKATAESLWHIGQEIEKHGAVPGETRGDGPEPAVPANAMDS